MHVSRWWPIMALFLGFTPQVKGQDKASCERLQIKAMDWSIQTFARVAPDSLRVKPPLQFETKDQKEIQAILAHLDTVWSRKAITESQGPVNARWVFDCFLPSGAVRTFVASAQVLTQPPEARAVAIDDDFRKFFTINQGFAERLKK